MNVALAEVLQECLPEWTVEGEALGKFQNSKAQPDIIVTERAASRSAAVIEAEARPGVQGAEGEAPFRSVCRPTTAVPTSYRHSLRQAAGILAGRGRMRRVARRTYVAGG